MPKPNCAALAVAAFATVVASSKQGRADADVARRFADAGTVSIGIERLAGLSFGTTDYGDTRLNSYDLALFGGPGSPIAHHAVRVAADLFPLPGPSVGASLVLLRNTTSAEQANGESMAMPEQTTLVASGRLGFAFETDEWLYFWPRAGLGYARTSVTGGGVDFRDERTTATLEAALVLTPFAPISLSFAPAADIDVAHRVVSSGTIGHPPKSETFGFYGGVGAWF
jgi:hypothetical protein